MMMGSYNEDQDDQFFDAQDEVASVSSSEFDGPETFCFSPGLIGPVPAGFGFDLWAKDPESIQERRSKFLKWIGACSVEDDDDDDDNQDAACDEEMEIDRISVVSDGGVTNLSISHGYSTSQSSMSNWSFDGALEENYACRIKNLDDGSEFIVDELEQNGSLKKLREVGSNRLITIEEFERSLGYSSMILQVMRRKVQEICKSDVATKKQPRKGWLRKLGSAACVVDRQLQAGKMSYDDCDPIIRNGKVKVRANKKGSKELSALYLGQDILAHRGSIFTMKFSPDGQYLASGGEDGVVRVWCVTELERSEIIHAPAGDPSHVYFTVNNRSELVPLHVEKEKKGVLKSLRKASDTACVIFPQKVFGISEKPLHEFHGHSGDVLNLSWSESKFLLSSSMDNTVRLWRVGSDQCLKVFLHNNYVTCVEFNPVDDGYFVSGSIDGKVRIWEISGCQVVDWTDITEIVTAVCYHPDGKGIIVGSMSGNCRFYDASDNRLQLHARVCLQGKKKSPLKRITGFQFSPNDQKKLMVTSANSQVRILHGVDVICKYKGLRNAGSQISASFTSDGTHIVSASEDSNVCMWNLQEGRFSPQVSTSWSCERFFSSNVSVAIPWCGNSNSSSSVLQTSSSSSPIALPMNLPRFERFGSPELSLGHGLFPEASSKAASATWPEEQLPSPGPRPAASSLCKSQYKFLKTSCQSLFSSPQALGLVIVTASLDGRIRTFQNYGLPIRA